MIYTITFNPSLDYIVFLDNLSAGKINMMKKSLILPGGKGINVSMMLNNLGMPSVAMGFLAGFTGKEIEKQLKAKDCMTDFIYLNKGQSRMNIKILADNETQINEVGPDIGKDEIQRFIKKIDKFEEEDCIVFSGSIPNGINNIYESILEKACSKKCKLVVDATGEILLESLKYKPFLVKPNNYELEETFNIKIKNEEDIIKYGLQLKEMGALNVLISLGKDGAILIDEFGTIHKSKAPDGKLINSIGSGDSMVAGFLYGYMNKKDYKEAFYTGVSSGSASAFSNYLGKKDEINNIMQSFFNTRL